MLNSKCCYVSKTLRTSSIKYVPMLHTGGTKFNYQPGVGISTSSTNISNRAALYRRAVDKAHPAGIIYCSDKANQK